MTRLQTDNSNPNLRSGYILSQATLQPLKDSRHPILKTDFSKAGILFVLRDSIPLASENMPKPKRKDCFQAFTSMCLLC